MTVVIAYGLLLPKAILAAPRHGCLNLHGSALPRWRGAAPIQRAIMAGDAETAVMVMRMDEGLDTGPICLTESVAIGPRYDGRRAARSYGAGWEPGWWSEPWPRWSAAAWIAGRSPHDRRHLRAQDQRMTKHASISTCRRERCTIRSAALSPAPGAWFEVTGGGRDSERIKVLRCGAGGGAGRAREHCSTTC